MTVMKDDVSHKRYVQCLNKDCCARGSQRRTAVKAVSAWNELSEKTIRSMSMKEVISIICRLICGAHIQTLDVQFEYAEELIKRFLPEYEFFPTWWEFNQCYEYDDVCRLISSIREKAEKIMMEQ